MQIIIVWESQLLRSSYHPSAALLVEWNAWQYSCASVFVFSLRWSPSWSANSAVTGTLRGSCFTEESKNYILFSFFFFPCEASQDKVRLLWHSSVLGWLQSERTALPTCDVREYLFRLMKWTNGCSSEALFSFRNSPKKLKSHKTTVTQPCTKTTKRAEPQVRGHGACLISGLVLHEIWSFFMGSGGVVLTEWVCWGKTHGAALV